MSNPAVNSSQMLTPRSSEFEEKDREEKELTVKCLKEKEGTKFCFVSFL
jgi:hypothetical protein